MKKFNIIALVAFLAVTGWMFLFRPDFVEAIQRGFAGVVAPLVKGKAALQPDPGPDGPVLSPKEMAEKLEALENEVVMLRLRNQDLEDLQEENASLRKALNYIEKSPLELVPAGVLNRETRTWYNTMEIDKGTRDGVSRDNPVIIPIGNDAGLVGKIILASAETSTVLLLTDEKCQVAASVVGSSHKGIVVGEQGTVIGQRGAINVMPFLNLRYLSKEAKLKPGDTAYSSGVGGVFPPSLLLGTVEELKPGPIDVSAKIRPAVDFSVLENVFVVQGVRG